jgi:hypothetical protein
LLRRRQTKTAFWLPQDAFSAAVAPDAMQEEQTLLAAVQPPVSLSCITTPVGQPLWKDMPGWFLIAKENRMKAHVHTHRVGHTPGVTAPALVVDTIMTAIASLPTEDSCGARKTKQLTPHFLIDTLHL